MTILNKTHVLQARLASLALALTGCAAEAATDDALPETASLQAALADGVGQGHKPSGLTLFSFESEVSRSEGLQDGDVRLDSVAFDDNSLSSDELVTVRRARILTDDGVDVERGGNNFASGQGISSANDELTDEGPATITPSGEDLAASLGNVNLTSIVVTRENVGTASLEVTFARPVDRFFFWERGNAESPTNANSDLLVEALDRRGRVTASHKLLRSEYVATGIEISTWNGSFASPSEPGAAYPQLGAAGLALDGSTRRLRLTSVQEEEGGVQDDGPDYKVLAASPQR